MNEFLLKIQTEAIYNALTGAMKLPDPALAMLIRTAHSLARLSAENDEKEDVMLLAELLDYFSTGSPMTEHIRAMILKARPSQLKSIIRGYLINYVYDL